MRVLMISTDRSVFKNGSAVQNRMKDYASFCESLDIVVFSKKSKGLISKSIGGNCKVYPTNSLFSLLFLRDAFKISSKILKNGKENFLVTTQDPFETGLVGLKIKNRFKIPFQTQVHTDFLNKYFRQESFKNKIRILIAKKVLPKADTVRVVSSRIKESLEKKYKLRSEPIVLPIFVDIKKIIETKSDFDLHQKYPQFNFIILMVSRLVKGKNIKFALDVFKKIKNSHPKAGLVIAGDGSQRRRLEKYSEKLGLSGSVIFEGEIKSNLISYYKTSNVFLHTSLFEGYGMALIEAAAAGLPIISSDVGVAGSFLEDKKNSLICRGFNLDCFVNNISAVIKDNQLRQTLIYNIKQKVSEVMMTKEEYLDLYKESWLETIKTEQ